MDYLQRAILAYFRHSAINDRFAVRASCINSLSNELDADNAELLKALNALRKRKAIVIYTRKSKYKVRTYGLPSKQYERCQNIRQKKVIRKERRLSA